LKSEASQSAIDRLALEIKKRMELEERVKLLEEDVVCRVNDALSPSPSSQPSRTVSEEKIGMRRDRMGWDSEIEGDSESDVTIEPEADQDTEAREKPGSLRARANDFLLFMNDQRKLNNIKSEPWPVEELVDNHPHTEENQPSRSPQPRPPRAPVQVVRVAASDLDVFKVAARQREAREAWYGRVFPGQSKLTATDII